ncbi:hypothetical protein ACWGDS_25870 [Streptomyces sp. NPDC055059]
MTTDVDLAELQPLAAVIAEKLRTVPVRLIGRGGADDLISELTIAVAVYCGKHVLPATTPPAPDPAETDEQRADREETERDHVRGDHTYCGVTCEAEFPSESMRNAILARAIPGSKGMLDELLRRARAEAAAPSAPADLPARLRATLTERFTALGNPYAEMRRNEKGPDGWPASHPLGPNDVAEVLRELLDGDEAQQHDGSEQ